MEIIDNIINQAQIELGLEGDDTTPIMRVWGYEALRTIGTIRGSIVKGDWQLLEDLQIRKPKGYIAPIQIAISKDKKCCYYPDMDSLMTKCGCCEQKCDCEVTVSENEEYLYFSSNAKQYKYVKITYAGVPLNDDGMPVVDETLTRAVKQYISFMYLRMRRNMDKSIPMSEIQYEEDRWIRLMKASRGRGNMPYIIEMDKIGKTWMQSGVNINRYVRYGNRN